MTLGKGDRCYFLEDGRVLLGRISGKRDNIFFIQTIGKCGSIQLEENEIFETEETAKQAIEKQKPLVSTFL